MTDDIANLRRRVEALEAARRPNVRPESQNPPEGTCLLSYRVENYALPIEEWGKGHTAVNLPTHNTPESSDSLVERVAIVCAMLAKWTWDDQVRAAIRVVAAWLRERGWEMGARRLEREAER